MTAPDWSKVYRDLSLPLHLDIGCGRGVFLMTMAQQEMDWNFLGLEIREPLVIHANQLRQELGLTNLHYLFCNVNNSLGLLLASLPAGSLHQVSIQFPDPWFKKRHQKRRVVQRELVVELAQALVLEGAVLIQSDVKEVAVEMCDQFNQCSAFEQQGSGWLETNPLPVATERERSTLERGEPVYRALFVKRHELA